MASWQRTSLDGVAAGAPLPEGEHARQRGRERVLAQRGVAGPPRPVVPSLAPEDPVHAPRVARRRSGPRRRRRRNHRDPRRWQRRLAAQEPLPDRYRPVLLLSSPLQHSRGAAACGGRAGRPRARLHRQKRLAATAVALRRRPRDSRSRSRSSGPVPEEGEMRRGEGDLQQRHGCQGTHCPR